MGCWGRCYITRCGWSGRWAWCAGTGRELEALLRGFNDSTRQAENGVEQLRRATDGAGRHLARQIEAGGSLRDDLAALIERGERLADRLDGLVRAARDLDTAPRRYELAEAAPQEPPGQRVRSQSERDLLRALRVKS